MPVIAETGDIPSTSFIMDNVSEVLNSEATTYERRDIPAGVYSVQVCNVLPREYFDKKDCFGGDSDSPMPDAIIKRLIPLEIIEGEFSSERTLISVYMEPLKDLYKDEERYKTHMKKYKMGCERMAKLAQACGLDSITDLDDCAGKFVRVTLTGREYNGKTYLDMKSAEKYGAAKPVLAPPKKEAAPAEAATEQAVKDEMPF
jgi:hypothetical protein